MLVSVDRYEPYTKEWLPNSFLELSTAMSIHSEAEEIADCTEEDIESIIDINGAFYYQVVYKETFHYDEDVNDNCFKVQQTATFRMTPGGTL